MNRFETLPALHIGLVFRWMEMEEEEEKGDVCGEKGGGTVGTWAKRHQAVGGQTGQGVGRRGRGVAWASPAHMPFHHLTIIPWEEEEELFSSLPTTACAAHWKDGHFI